MNLHTQIGQRLSKTANINIKKVVKLASSTVLILESTQIENILTYILSKDLIQFLVLRTPEEVFSIDWAAINGQGCFVH